MGEQDQVRQAVSDSYAKAVTSQDGCCCGSPVQKGVVAKLAGYTREELESLPPEAVTNSFGCGNPLAFVEVQEGQTVLDLGSGAGIDVLLAAKIVGPTGSVIGVDMTDEMIAKARDNAAAAGLNNVEMRKGIIEKLPVEDDSVDWVISNCVINLSPEKHKVFAEIARVLRPGGRMHVSDIVATDLPDWVRRDKTLYSSCIAGAISEEEYLAGLQAAGLEDAQVRERFVYDEVQLSGFIASELPENREAFGSSGCCGSDVSGGRPTGHSLEEMTRAMVGKVWSVKISARKPAQ